MKSTIPEGLKPYFFHGVELNYRRTDKEATGECPFCGRENKFSVNIYSSKYRCLVCGEEGNQYDFVRRLWEESVEALVDFEQLSKDRGVSRATLEAWGITRSILTGDWIVPGYNVKGKVIQLYKYANKKLLATPTIVHGMFGTNLYDPKKPVVYLCEGPWDAMKLWEALATHLESKNGTPLPTKNKEKNLLSGANVLAVPGCSTFQRSWSDVFLRKKVYIAYDNDYPRKHPKTGKKLPPAGYAGVERVSGILRDKTKEINFLRWGREGYDSKLPAGTDVRDVLTEEKNGLRILFSRWAPVPKQWLVAEIEKKTQQTEVRPKECTSWVKLSNQWRKALRWGDGLDVSLSVMLASVLSTDLVGDQLWVKIIGPASCGKSTLCEAVSTNKQYVLAKSTIRGFHSGFKTDSDGSEDNSLLAKVANKTLVTKDGDTLLQSPNLSQILSEGRDIYDKTSRTHYRNKTSREYTGINMTWILSGTSSLRSIDSSELGERFLDCVIMEGIDDELEDEVLLRVAEREDANLSGGLNGVANLSHDRELNAAMALTGGYVDYLRKNDKLLLSEITTPRNMLLRIIRIGKFVAYMRARPSRMQQEEAEREFGARLVSQHLRLAKCLAAVLNRKVVDSEVMRRTKKVALDTSRGLTLEICKALQKQQLGTSVSYLVLVTNQTDYKVREMLLFLKRIGAVEQFTPRKVKGIRAKRKWRLTAKLKKLFREVGV